MNINGPLVALSPGDEAKLLALPRLHSYIYKYMYSEKGPI